MKKTWTYFSLALALYGTNSLAGSMGYVEQRDWTGFYAGVNAGAIWSANNIMDNTGYVLYANPAFLPLSEITAISLAAATTNRIYSDSSSSFMGGAQIGYNAQFADNLVISLATDLDALRLNRATTHTQSLQSSIGTYTANVTMTKKLDYIGFVKGRLGYLISPTLLAYGTGAFAYGGASLKTTYSVTSTQSAFLPVYNEYNKNRILGGWAAGGGVEWLFAPCWSVKAEYLYYDLGSMHRYNTLSQQLNATPATTYAQAIIESQAKYSGNTIRLGVNYHFA